MSKRNILLNSISGTIRDYRFGELETPLPEHVDRWVKQFDGKVQLPILREMDYVLKKTYFSKRRVSKYLKQLVESEPLAGNSPCAFWRGVHFLSIQSEGDSQRALLELFNKRLVKKCRYGIEDCGDNGSQYLYLDDGIYTGNRVRHDIEAWVKEQAPQMAKLQIVTIASHRGGRYYAERSIKETISATGKSIEVKWGHAIYLEDRKAYSDAADVLRPTKIPQDSAVLAYVRNMGYQPVLRSPGNVGSNGLYSSEKGKTLLEQEFLKAGVKIRCSCPNLGATQRPLGHMTLDTLGFGSLIVTYRNCPNNAPLALWVGDPWYPLFPRTTNNQSAMNRWPDDLENGGH